MALRTSEEDTKLDPGQQDYDRKFQDIKKAEEDATFNDIAGNYDKNPEGTDGDNAITKTDLAEKESEPPKGDWNTDVKGGDKNDRSRLITGANVRAILKRRGPIGLILTIGLGGGLFGSLLFSPGIMLVQMKESLVDRFNTQLPSMDVRTTKLLNAKIASLTGGICGTTITIGCKLSTISEKQAARFKAQGIEIIDGTSTKFGNRIKPAGYIFQGKEMDGPTFVKEMKTNTELRRALSKAYSPKYAGFADDVWTKVATKLGLSKARNLPDGDAATKSEALDDQVKNGKKLPIADSIICDDAGECVDRNSGKPVTEAEAEAARAAKAAATETIDEIADTGEKALEQAVEAGAKGTLSAVGNFVKVTGLVDSACQAYTAVRGLGYAAKTVRAIQLARYAMAFVNTADQIKAGTADASDVAYLGGIITNIAYDAKTGAARKAGMDSAGIKYSMFGDTSGFSGQAGAYVSQFMAGGGLVGDLIVVTDYINNVTGGTPRTTCRTLSNPWVQAGSAAAGIALMLIPGVNVVVGFADVAKGVAGAAVGIGLALLPQLLKDIVAGNVTKGLVGEDATNAITSGFGVTASSLSQGGGNGPLGIDDAVEYTNLQQETVARYAAEERETLSPFDPTSKNTFLGSIVNKLLPYSDDVASIGGSLTMLGSIVSSSFSSILPTSKALTNEQLRAAYTSSNDLDLNYLGVAADPFGNPIFGIPKRYLDRDPIEVSKALSGQYNEETGRPVPNSTYASYVTDCIERVNPLGSGGDDDSGDDGSKCKINDSNANYYLFYMDQRIDAGMDGYSEKGVSTSTDKRTLAKKIIAKGKVTYSTGAQPTLESIADGSTDPNAEPCGINLYILKLIDKITDKHSIRISDINRQCINSTVNGQSSTKSRHYAGNGSAVDIDAIDGTPTNGRDANAISVINDVMPILVDAGTAGGGYSQVGQFGCGPTITIPDSLRVHVIRDSCDHLHLDVPAVSDKTLKYTPGGW